MNIIKVERYDLAINMMEHSIIVQALNLFQMDCNVNEDFRAKAGKIKGELIKASGDDR